MRGLLLAAWAALFGNIEFVGQLPAPCDRLAAYYLGDELPIPLLGQRQKIRIPAEGGAEAGKSPPLEFVAIAYFTKNNESSAMRGSLEYLNKIGLHNVPALAEGVIERLREAAHLASRGDIVSAAPLRVKGREGELLGQRPFGQLDDRVSLKFMSRGEAIILKRVGDPHLFRRLDLSNVDGGTGDISTQLSFGRLIGTSNEPVSRAPETPSSDCREYKSLCRESQSK